MERRDGQTAALSAPRGDSLLAALMALALGALAFSVVRLEHAFLYLGVFTLLALWLVPAWVHRHRGWIDYFEPIHAVGLVYFAYFGIGAAWTIGDPANVAYDRHIVRYIPLALWLGVAGYACLCAGYFGPWGARRHHRRREEWPRSSLFLLLPAAIGLGGFLVQAQAHRAMRLGLPIGVFSSFGQLAPLFLFAWSLGWLIMLSGRATRAQRWLFVAVLLPGAPLIMLNQLNRKSMVLAILATPLIALWYTRRRMPWKTLAVLLFLAVFVIFPFNNTFRQLDSRMTTGQRLALTSAIVGQWNTRHYLDRSVGTFKARMSLVNSMAVVVRDTPRWVPYAMGRTIFIPVAINAIPRVLWPDKPKFTFGREFGKTFRVVNPFDRETAIAPTIPGELYWNFGVLGVLVGMALWGWLLRLAYRRYGEGRELDPVSRAIHIVLLIQFLHFESGITSLLVGIGRSLILIELYRHLAAKFELTESLEVSA